MEKLIITAAICGAEVTKENNPAVISKQGFSVLIVLPETNNLLFAQFVTEIHLSTSSMTIQLRKGKPMTRDGRKITSGMLQNKREVEKLVRNKDAVRFMQPLRGTPAYWEKTTRDLFAMIRQLGTPTFFCTFSAAEMRWPEVIEAIKRQQGEEVHFEGLDWSAKCDILRSNPVRSEERRVGKECRSRWSPYH